MTNDLISIIIPIYNVEELLERCLVSLINQTYKNIEILLIDDGSTDTSGTICDEYSKQYNNIYAFHKENGGSSDARNYGLSKAKGEYICFIDSDDYVDKRYCEILYKNLIKTKSDISICQFTTTEEIKEVQIDYENEEVKIYSSDVEKQENILNEFNTVTTVPWSKLYKRTIWEGIKYPKGKIHEDEFVVHYLIDKCKKVVYTSLKLYYYYQSENSVMRAEYNEKRLVVIDAFKDRMEFYKAKEKYKSLVPKAYVLYMKMIIRNYILARKSKMKKIYINLIKMYRENFDRNIGKIGIKDKLQLLLFFYFPIVYYFIKNCISDDN